MPLDALPLHIRIAAGDFAAWLTARDAEFERLLDAMMDDHRTGPKGTDDAG